MAAELEQLNLRITGDLSGAASAIDTTISSLNNLKSALSSVGSNSSGVAQFSTAIAAIGDALKGISGSDSNRIESLAAGLAGLGSAMGQLASFNATSFDGLAESVNNLCAQISSISPKQVETIRKVADAMELLKGNEGNIPEGGMTPAGAFNSLIGKMRTSISLMSKFRSVCVGAAKAAVKEFNKLQKSLSLSNTLLGKLINKLVSRAISMAMRAIIKAITSAFKDGLEALYHYSSEAKSTLDGISTSLSGLKASAGSALYSAISMVSGAIEWLISVATTALNAVSALFSAISGGTTYFAGLTKQTDMYSDSSKSAKSSADKLKSSLMGFDEINKLQDPSSGSGGGSSGSTPSWANAGTFEKNKIPQMLLDAVNSGDFSLIGYTIGKKITDALVKIDWNKLRSKAVKLGNSIATFINGALTGLNPSVIGRSLAGVITAALAGINQFWYTTDWFKLGKWVRESIASLFTNLNAEDIAGFILRKFQAAIKFLTGLLEGGIDWDSVTVKVLDILGGIGSGLKDLNLPYVVSLLCDGVTGAFNTVATWIQSPEFSTIRDTIIDAVGVVFENLPEMVGGFANLALSLWNSFVRGLNKYFSEHSLWQVLWSCWEAIKTAVKNNGGVEIPWTMLLVFAGLTGLQVLLAAAKSALVVFAFQKLWKGLKFGGAMTKITKGVGSAVIGAIGVYIGVKGILEAFDLVSDSIKYNTTLDVGALLSKLGTGLTGFGVAAAAFGVPVAGVILISLGAVLKIVGMVWDLSESAAAEMFDPGAMTDGQQAIIASAEKYKDYMKLYEMLPSMGINMDTDQFDKLFHVFSKIAGVDLSNASNDWGNVTKAFYILTNVLTGQGARLTGYATGQFYALAKASGEFDNDALRDLATILGLIDTTNVEDLGTESDTAATAVDNLSTSAVDSQSDIEDLAGKYSILAEAGSDVDTQLGNVITVMHELPTEKEITVKFGNYFTLVQQIANINRYLNDIKDRTVNVYINTISTFSGSGFGVTKRASGGFTSPGEVFIAGESGAEMVGNINGRSAVANQGEIGDAIFKYMSKYGSNNSSAIDESKLASAIVGACRSAGMGAVYLDGRQLAQSINRESMRIGKSAVR